MRRFGRLVAYATHHSRRELCGPKDANPKPEGADHRDGVCYVHTQYALDLPTFSLEREAIFHLNVEHLGYASGKS